MTISPITTPLVSPGNEGAKVDAVQLNNGTELVKRQIAAIGDPNTHANMMSVNADGSVNVDKVAELLTKITEMLDRMPVNGNGIPIVTTAKQKFRDAFLSFDTTNNWTVLQTGAGIVQSVAGSTVGSRYLNLNSGTTPNSEYIIISKATFKAPVTIMALISASARNVNNSLFYEIVEVDPATGLPIDDTTIPEPLFNNARNAAGFRFNNATATTQDVQVRQDGTSAETAALTLTTTAATGTGPNFIPAGIFEITLRTRDIQFSSTAINGVAAKVAPTGSQRNSRVPNPDATYALRIRVKNGATPVAIDWRIHGVTILEDARMSVDFGGIAGIPLPQNAPPVQVINTITAAISGAISANTTLASAGGTIYNDTTTPLALNATFTGTSRDAGATNTMRKFCANIFTDQAGTFRIEMSNDNTTWRTAKTFAVTANTPIDVEIPVCTRYYRVVYVNGGVAQTILMINSAFHRV